MNVVDFAKEVRKQSIRMVHKAKASHIGSALSMADILAVLYNGIINVDPKDPNYDQRDRFVLSKGHGCVSLYAALGVKGFFPISDLESYGQNDSDFMNHVSHKVPGVEFSTGSLGHGLPFATGIALSLKLKNSQSHVYTILGDGEIGEGSNWEALLFAAHQKLDNLTFVIDHNNLQSLTTVEKTMNIEPIGYKLKSFGCDVYEVDGHNHGELEKVLSNSRSQNNGNPKAVIAKTIKGKGVSFMEDTVKWHYSSPSEDDLKIALKEIGNA